MKLNRSQIHELFFTGGSPTRAQVRVAGIFDWPPLRGWIEKLDAHDFTEAEIEQILALPKTTKKRSKWKDRDTPELFTADTAEAFANELFENDRGGFD